MAFPRHLLYDDETVVVDLHPHWWYFSRHILTGIALLGLVILTANIESPDVRTVVRWPVGLLVLVWAVWLTGTYLRWLRTYFVVTDQRVLYRSGVLGRRGVEIPLDRISDIDYRQGLGNALAVAGNLRNNAGRPAEALPFFERSLEIRQRLAADYPTATLHQHELARLHMFISRDLVELGRPGAALKPLERAVALFERLMADHPGVTGYTEELAFTQLQIAKAQRGLGRPAEARRALERAIEIHQGMSSPIGLYNLACAESRLRNGA